MKKKSAAAGRTLARQVADHHAKLSYNQVPAGSRHAMKRLLLDYLGVAIAGSQTESGVIARELVWVGLGVVAAYVTFRLSPRLLEWGAPAIYGLSLLLLVLVLFVGTGAGSAAGSKSWLASCGVRLGQPVELAKLALILLLARYLSSRREPPDSLRELLVPCVMAGVPMLLVLAQPDLGSAIVFMGILFAMLFWAGTPVALLVLVASPVVSLFVSYDTRIWSWYILAVIAFLYFYRYRRFLFESVALVLANFAAATISRPLWNSLATYQQNRILVFLDPEVDPPLLRSLPPLVGTPGGANRKNTTLAVAGGNSVMVARIMKRLW